MALAGFLGAAGWAPECLRRGKGQEWTGSRAV